MTAYKIENPFEFFSDGAGNALDGGKIYIGTAGLDAETNPIAVYLDAAETTPAAQPIRTTAGYPTNGGGAVDIFTADVYSITVRDANDALVYSELNASNDAPVLLSLPVYFDTVTDFFSATLAEIKERANSTTGTVYVNTNDGIGSYTVDLTQTSSFNMTTTGGVEATAIEQDGGGVNAGSYNDDLDAAITNHESIFIPDGVFTLAAKIGEIQSRVVRVTGNGLGSTLHVDNVDNTGVDIGATGGNDDLGGARVITLFQDLNWTTTTKTDETPCTAIDAQSVNPTNIVRNRFYGLGPDAVKLRRLYYGAIQDTEFVKSGLSLQNVNNYQMIGGGFFGGANGLPSAAIMFGTGAVINLFNDDTFRGPEGFNFTGVVFESWMVDLFRLQLANLITFTNCWFEAITGDYIFRLEQNRRLDFNDTKFDLAYAGTAIPFFVDNSGPSADADDIRENGIITINRGEWRALPSRTDSVKVVDVNAGEVKTVRFNDVALTRGHWFSDPTVIQDVRGVLLATDDQKSFYSKPNAILTRSLNSWMPDSLSTDWDFTGGADFAMKSGTTGLTITTSSTGTDYLTGSVAAKISGYASDGVKRTIERNTGGDMGPVAVEGETYLFFVRLKSTVNVTFEIGVRGFSLEHAGTPEHTLPADEWRDYVFKSQADTTFAQNGPAFSANPKLFLHVTNNSGSVADVLIDRVDYQICNGDHLI